MLRLFWKPNIPWKKSPDAESAFTNAFVLWNHEYMQPPYRPEDNFLKMVLMVHGDLKEDRDFNFVRRTIYKEVYMREV